YSVASTPISVPTSSSHKELNDVIGQLLEDTGEHSVKCEFDFLINNEFLTTTLNEYIIEKQLSLEVIEVDALTGSYDQTVQVWDLCNSSRVLRLELDEKVKCVEWLEFDKLISFLTFLRSDPDGAQKALFVTGGFDQSAYLWSWDMKTNHVKCIANCRGHSETIMTVASGPPSSKLDTRLFATGSWDGTVKVWSADPEVSDLTEETGGIGHTRKSLSKIPTRIPRMTLAGHRETVTRVCWLDNQSQKQANSGAAFQLISVGWDHTLRLWDCQVESGSQTEALALIGFQGHTAWLTSVAWAPHRDNQFVTGSIDRSVRLWDTRNPRSSLYDLMGHSDMVTDVDWAPPTKPNKSSATDNSDSVRHLILSASADGTVKVYEYPNCK
ncbi:Ribosome biogenesis protein WDR12, partial [Fasciolopsis buskii]